MINLDIKNKLIMLGLTEKEAVVYIAAIELGVFSVLSISAKSNIKRPTCYLILEELEKKGLISKVPRAKKTMYAIEDPDLFLEKMQSRVVIAKEIIPELKKNLSSSKPVTVRFFSGKNSVEKIYRDMIEVKKPIKAIISSRKLFNSVGADFLKEWGEKRVINNISIDSLYTDNVGFMEDKKYLRRVKMLPEGLKIQGSFAMYGDKVAFLSKEKTEFGFIVSNQEYNDTIRAIFDFFWNLKAG